MRRAAFRFALGAASLAITMPVILLLRVAAARDEAVSW